MGEYYLISQLPSLDSISDGSQLPITYERFLMLCESLLSKKYLQELKKITLIPSKDAEKSSSCLIEAWNEGERKLRIALAKLRADKMNKHYDAEIQSFPVVLLQVARAAVDIESPLDAEKYLNRCRLDFLETLRPMDSFSTEFVFYYALKLKLIERISLFDSKRGESAYRNIYDVIINSDRTEVI